MAKKPELIHTVKVGGKSYRLRTNKAFFPSVYPETIKATGPQMRNLAFGSYTLLVEKVLAGSAQGLPTRLRLQQMPFYDSRTRGLDSRSPFRFPPLREDYVERKAAAGLDPRPLIATGFYLENIQVTEEDSDEGTLYSVYVPDIEHPDAKVPLPVLVGWLEYGTAGPHGMPPRPHWRPTVLAVRRRWQRLPKDIRADALRKALRTLR